jgi:hypothetical protein
MLQQTEIFVQLRERERERADRVDYLQQTEIFLQLREIFVQLRERERLQQTEG